MVRDIFSHCPCSLRQYLSSGSLVPDFKYNLSLNCIFWRIGILFEGLKDYFKVKRMIIYILQYVQKKMRRNKIATFWHRLSYISTTCISDDV